MIISPAGLGTKNDCAGENKQNFNWPTGSLFTGNGKSKQLLDSTQLPTKYVTNAFLENKSAEA
jgi:hypothetical protein